MSDKPWLEPFPDAPPETRFPSTAKWSKPSATTVGHGSALHSLRPGTEVGPGSRTASKLSPGGNHMSRWQKALVRTTHGQASRDPEHVAFQPTYVWIVSLLGTYADYDNGHRAYPGNARLKDGTGVSVATITRAIRWAKQAGWIEQVAAARKGQRPAEFRMTFPDGLVVDLG